MPYEVVGFGLFCMVGMDKAVKNVYPCGIRDVLCFSVFRAILV